MAKSNTRLAPLILFIAAVNMYIGLRVTVYHSDIVADDLVTQSVYPVLNTTVVRLSSTNASGLGNNTAKTHLDLHLDSRVTTSRIHSWLDFPVAREFLQTMAIDVLNQTPPKFVEGLQSHCFVTERAPGNHNHEVKLANPTNKKKLNQKLRRQYLIGDQPSFNGLTSLHAEQLHCLPPFYFIGFSKCGTTEFYGHFVQHQHIVAPVFKEPRFWDESRPMSKQKRSFEYMTQNHETLAAIIESCYLGNDSQRCHGNFQSNQWDLDIQLNLDELYEELQKYKSQGRPCPLVTVDSSTTYVSNSYMWENDPNNVGLEKPKILTPHRIHHIQPNAKFIVLLRDPVHRLFSDFNFFVYGRGKTPQFFHKLVVSGIAWWEQCTKIYNDETCAYAYTLPNMPPLPKGTFNWGDAAVDKFNSAGRIRQSLYSIFISKWYEVVPKENMLVIKFEEFSANSEDILKSQVYPFLDMAPLSKQGETRLKALQSKGHLNKAKGKTVKMLPETEVLLKKFFQPYNEKLATLLGDDKFLW